MLTQHLLPSQRIIIIYLTFGSFLNSLANAYHPTLHPFFNPALSCLFFCLVFSSSPPPNPVALLGIFPMGGPASPSTPNASPFGTIYGSYEQNRKLIDAMRNKAPVPDIDFSIHVMEDGSEVSTQERVCKGTNLTSGFCIYHVNRCTSTCFP